MAELHEDMTDKSTAQNERDKGDQLPTKLWVAHQKFALLFPGGPFGVGVSVGFSHHPDELPLRRVRLRPGLQHPNHFLPLPPLPVLLDQTPLGYAL